MRIRNTQYTAGLYFILIFLGYTATARFGIWSAATGLIIMVFCVIPIFLERAYDAQLHNRENIDWTPLGFVPQDPRKVFATDNKWKNRLYRISRFIMFLHNIKHNGGRLPAE